MEQIIPHEPIMIYLPPSHERGDTSHIYKITDMKNSKRLQTCLSTGHKISSTLNDSNGIFLHGGKL